LFRSTAYHNTVGALDYEQNSFVSADLFLMNNESSCRLLVWQDDFDLGIYLAGEFVRHVSPKIMHQRSFFLDKNARVLLITDWIIRVQTQLWSFFHITPGLITEYQSYPYSAVKLTNVRGQTVQILSIEKADVRLSTGWISESYGSRRPSNIVSMAQNIGRFNRTVILLPESDNPSTRLEDIVKHESQLLDRYKLTPLGKSQ
jgi:hypothetical protein